MTIGLIQRISRAEYSDRADDDGDGEVQGHRHPDVNGSAASADSEHLHAAGRADRRGWYRHRTGRGYSICRTWPNVSAGFRWMQQVYSLSFVPFDPRGLDALWIAGVAIGVSFLATLYPARQCYEDLAGGSAEVRVDRMCGIAGFTHLRGAGYPRELIARGDAIHSSPRSGSVRYLRDRTSVSLAAVRLKIIDLTGGEQPMRRRGDYGDRVQWRGLQPRGDPAELEGAGRAVSLALRYRSGSEGFSAVGTRHHSRGCAACSRSPCGLNPRGGWCCAATGMGIKPLYIHQRGDDLYFGSELKTLFVHRRDRAAHRSRRTEPLPVA